MTRFLSEGIEGLLLRLYPHLRFICYEKGMEFLHDRRLKDSVLTMVCCLRFHFTISTDHSNSNLHIYNIVIKCNIVVE